MSAHRAAAATGPALPAWVQPQGPLLLRVVAGGEGGRPRLVRPRLPPPLCLEGGETKARQEQTQNSGLPILGQEPQGTRPAAASAPPILGPEAGDRGLPHHFLYHFVGQEALAHQLEQHF